MVKRGAGAKFPVARIKKIMQADEDVGKVAQATPVLISKALELFLSDIVSATAAETKSKGARKVTAYHLKRAVYQTQTLDFLKDIVDKVADPIGAEALAGNSGDSVAAAPPIDRPSESVASTSKSAAASAATRGPTQARSAPSVSSPASHLPPPRFGLGGAVDILNPVASSPSWASSSTATAAAAAAPGSRTKHPRSTSSGNGGYAVKQEDYDDDDEDAEDGDDGGQEWEDGDDDDYEERKPAVGKRIKRE